MLNKEALDVTHSHASVLDLTALAGAWPEGSSIPSHALTDACSVAQEERSAMGAGVVSTSQPEPIHGAPDGLPATLPGPSPSQPTGAGDPPPPGFGGAR